jgi:hypothetical protein
MPDPLASPEIEAVRNMVARFMHSGVVAVLDGYEKRGEIPLENGAQGRKGWLVWRCIPRGGWRR